MDAAIEAAIRKLAIKASGSYNFDDSEAAVKFAQAALTLAEAKAVLAQSA